MLAHSRLGTLQILLPKADGLWEGEALLGGWLPAMEDPLGSPMSGIPRGIMRGRGSRKGPSTDSSPLEECSCDETLEVLDTALSARFVVAAECPVLHCIVRF